MQLMEAACKMCLLVFPDPEKILGIFLEKFFFFFFLCPFLLELTDMNLTDCIILLV